MICEYCGVTDCPEPPDFNVLEEVLHKDGNSYVVLDWNQNRTTYQIAPTTNGWVNYSTIYAVNACELERV